MSRPLSEKNIFLIAKLTSFKRFFWGSCKLCRVKCSAFESAAVAFANGFHMTYVKKLDLRMMTGIAFLLCMVTNSLILLNVSTKSLF